MRLVPIIRFVLRTFLVTCLAAVPFSATAREIILNVSYDVTREFYEEYNPLFVKHWQEKTGRVAAVKQSHAGSTKQARGVIDGLPAHVVTMNQPTDLDAIAERGRALVPKDWRSRFPNNSSPCTSTMAMMVRAGNPKGIKDWDDLARPGISVVLPNPKTSGNGRYSYLALWHFASERFDGDDAKIKTFLRNVFQNVPILEAGGRGATTTFVQRGVGDVLLNFEAEILMSIHELGSNRFQVVYPSVSVQAEIPVAVVDRVVDRAGTRELATEYLNFLWSEPAQELMVKHGYRPRLESVAKKSEGKFGTLRLFTVEEKFGGWSKALQDHFGGGGSFDQIYASRRK